MEIRFSTGNSDIPLLSPTGNRYRLAQKTFQTRLRRNPTVITEARLIGRSMTSLVALLPVFEHSWIRTREVTNATTNRCRRLTSDDVPLGEFELVWSPIHQLTGADVA